TVTSTVPVPAGETAVIEVSEFTVKLAALVEPNLTAVAPVKSLPVIVTDVPPDSDPELGSTRVTFRPETGTNTHAAPTALLSPAPPIRAVVEENATLMPKFPLPISPIPVSFGPCCVQVEPERVNTHAAPISLLSPGPPISAVSPSEESVTA